MKRLQLITGVLVLGLWIGITWVVGPLALVGAALTLVLGAGMAYRRYRAEQEAHARDERIREAIARSNRPQRP
ncbi:MAG TPA: hypothetical protein VJ483_08995 [Holophagaceae bacterium]|nr:hypothetical protein [Holophagaceae bacterium]